MSNVPIPSSAEIKKYLNKCESLKNYVKLKRQHIKFKEGDYFRAKLRKNL